MFFNSLTNIIIRTNHLNPGMQLMKLYQGKRFSSLTNFRGNYYKGTLLL